MAEALNSWPQSSSVIVLILRVETPLHIHLDQGRNQRLLRTLITLEELGGEAALAILRHAQLHGAHAGHQAAGIVATAVTLAGFAALAFGRTERIGHLLLKDLLE
jgi:hypothetical protein